MIYHNVSSGVSGPDHVLSWLLISELQVMGRKIKHETWGAPITWRMPDPIPRWLFARSYVNQEKSGNCNHHPCGIIPSLWLFWRKTERKSCDIIDPLSSQQYTPANFHCESPPVSMLSIWKLICQRKHPSWGRRGTNTRCGPSFPLLVSGVAISVCDPLASVGGAGLGEGNIHNYFSASHNLWQGSVLVCCVLEAHSALCNQSPNWLTTHFVRIH